MGGYDAGYLLGATVGVLIGLAVVVPLLKFMKKDGRIKSKFDERQEHIRGQAFKYGFFTYLFYLAMDALYGNYLELVMEHGLIAFAGLLLGTVVYAGYAIWNDGYFSLNDNPVRVILIFTILSLINLGIAGMHIFGHKDIVENGVLSMNAITLFCGIMLLIILFLVLIKSACKKA